MDKPVKRSARRVPSVDEPLSPREVEVANRYTDPTSPTYLNGTRTIKASHGYSASTDNSAAVRAIEVLNRPNVANYVRERLNAIGMSEDTRLQIVSNIAKGYIETIESETTGRDGEVASRTVTRRPLSAKMQLAAIQHLNRVDGTDDMRRAEANVLSDAMRRLSRAMLRERDVTPADDTLQVPDAVVTRLEALTGDEHESAESEAEYEPEREYHGV